MPYRKFVIPAVGLLIVIVGYLAFGSLNDSLVYYLTPAEAIEQRADFADGKRFRLGGQVESGSIESTQIGVRFVLTDGARRIVVNHEGAPPQLFQEGTGAVVEGAWAGKVFQSDVLSVKHDEQYRAPEGDEPYEPPPGS